MAETSIAVAVVSIAAVGMAIAVVRGGGTQGRLLAVLLSVGAIATSWGIAAYEPVPPAPGPDNRPLEAPEDGYVSSDACLACHPAEYRSWRASYHSKMTQVARPETVLAPFEGERVTVGDRSWVFERRGDEFWVELEDLTHQGPPPLPRVWRRIVQTTGSHHQQFYWYATESTRELGIVHAMYVLGDEPRWMPLDACCVSPPTDHYEAGLGRWSWNCIRCHATHGKPRIDGPHDMDTRVSELGIACESCHGPAREHTAANGDVLRRYVLHGDDDAVDDTVVNPARLSPRDASLVCASCHSVNLHATEEDEAAWRRDGYVYRPGDSEMGTRKLITTGADRFWSDGVIRVSGREYNGLVQTPCFERGEMSCLSCHRLHAPMDDPVALERWRDDQLKDGMRGDEGCTQCHAAYENAAKVEQHSHHAADSAGSRCYNCHMPYTTYGLLKGIRSHQLDVPSVAASVASGRPNGCNQCHLDQTLAWTARHLDEWYGIESPPLSGDEATVAASVLWTIKGEAGQRALMAWSFGWDEARAASGTDWMTPYLVMLMNDHYDAVRFIAQRSHDKQVDRIDSDFDFTWPSDRRLEWMLASLRSWIARSGPVRPGAEQLLFDAHGRFDVPRLDGMLDERDNRDVTLNE